MNVLDSSTTVVGCVDNAAREQESLTSKKMQSASLADGGMSHVSRASHSAYNLSKQTE